MTSSQSTPDLWITRYTTAFPADTPEQRVTERAQQLHQAAMSLFGPPVTEHGRSEKNILWRLEPGTDRWYTTIQSTVAPTDEARSLPHIDVKPVNGLFDAIEVGTTVYYRVQIASQRRYNTKQGRRDLLLTLNQATERWRTHYAVRAGLRPDTDREQIERHGHPHRDRRPQRHTAWSADRYTGYATVTDPDALRYIARRGVGYRKTYGCGLLSVVPVDA